MSDTTAADKRVQAELDVLRNIHFADMPPQAVEEWQAKVGEIKSQYKAARAVERNEAADGKDKAYAKSVTDSINKNLPLISKGMQSAIVAFSKGDALGGAAAIMDVCSAAAPLIGALCSAVGPAGMVVGALFAVLGQILTFFGPKQPSLKDQIQEMLVALKTEEQLQKLDAIRLSNEVREGMLADIARNLAEPTNLSLLMKAELTGLFDGGSGIAGKTIVVMRGSAASDNTSLRYPKSKIRYLDEVARGASALDEVAAGLMAGTVHAFYDVDQRNRSFCAGHPGLSRADVHTMPGQIPSVLELPLENESEANAFDVRLGAVIYLVKRAAAKVDAAEFANWEVAAWLQSSKNYGNARWPQVLSVWCRVYNDRVSSNTTFNCLIDPRRLDELVRFTDSSRTTCKVPPGKRIQINAQLLDLQSLALSLRLESLACNRVALEVLDKITPVARAWGMFAICGISPGLYFRTGPTNQSDWTYRGDGNLYQNLIMLPSAVQSEAGRSIAHDEPNQRYRCLVFKHKDPFWDLSRDRQVWLEHYFLHSNFDIENARVLQDHLPFVELCVAQRGDRTDCWTAPPVRSEIIGWTLDNADQMVRTPDRGMTVDRAPVGRICATYPAAGSLVADDPDAESIEPGAAWLDPAQPGYAALIYAGLRTSRELYVNASGAGHYVPTPWADYTGVACDSQYVWVFRPNGFACATHASVLACAEKKRAEPRWMQHTLPELLLGRFLNDRDGKEVGPDQIPMDGSNGGDVHWVLDGHFQAAGVPTLSGLTSLSPCADGTIFASIVNRIARFSGPTQAHPYLHVEATETSDLYTTGYHVDAARQTIALDQPWIKFNGVGSGVQKAPIACWPLLLSLRTKLEAA